MKITESSKAAMLKKTLAVFEGAKNLISLKKESIWTTKLARNDMAKHAILASTKIVSPIVFESQI